MRSACTAAVIAAVVGGGCGADERGPVAGPELWRVPAPPHPERMSASGEGAVYAVTSEDTAFILTRVDDTGTAWSLPLPDRRTPFVPVAGGDVLIVTTRLASGGDATDFSLQRVGRDGSVVWERPIGRATSPDAWAPAVVVVQDEVFALIRVSVDATLDVAGTLITGEDQTCDEPAIDCELTALVHLSADGEVIRSARIATPLFEITSTAVVEDALVIAGYTHMFAVEVPWVNGGPLSPSWVVEPPEGMVMQLMAADTASLYVNAWSAIGYDQEESQETLLRFGVDGLQQWESDPLADAIAAVMPAADGVTALVSEVVNGIASGWFLADVDGEGRLVRRETLGDLTTADATGDADGRLFLLENIEIVARAPLP